MVIRNIQISSLLSNRAHLWAAQLTITQYTTIALRDLGSLFARAPPCLTMTLLESAPFVDSEKRRRKAVM